jgi:hypothetical protein
MPPFLTVGGITVEVLRSGATQNTSEKLGETVRAVAGNLISTVRGTKRKWTFDTGPMLPADEDDLRAVVNADTEIVVSGDALGGASVMCVVEMGDTTYISDGTTDGFYRFATLTITEV